MWDTIKNTSIRYPKSLGLISAILAFLILLYGVELDLTWSIICSLCIGGAVTIGLVKYKEDKKEKEEIDAMQQQAANSALMAGVK